MDSHEEHVIIACGLYLLTEGGKLVEENYWICSVF
jgi:hypothetical protein